MNYKKLRKNKEKIKKILCLKPAQILIFNEFYGIIKSNPKIKNTQSYPQHNIEKWITIEKYKKCNENLILKQI